VDSPGAVHDTRLPGPASADHIAEAFGLIPILHIFIIQGESHCILVWEWDMKLGNLPLWSAWKNLLNDVLKVDFNVAHIFAKKRTQPKAFYNSGSKFNLKQNGHHLNAPFMLITMVQIPAPYLIPSPRYLV